MTATMSGPLEIEAEIAGVPVASMPVIFVS
jgi:hypothetical protein